MKINSNTLREAFYRQRRKLSEGVGKRSELVFFPKFEVQNRKKMSIHTMIIYTKTSG
jgi:hypothetical protein